MFGKTLSKIVNLADRRETAAQTAARAAAPLTFTLEERDAACAAAYAESFELGKSEGFAAGVQECHAKVAGGREAGLKQGYEAEKVRLRAIFGSDAAKGRTDLANYFAFDTDMAADAVNAALSKAPVSAPAAGAPNSSLLAEMAAMRRPSIGASPATSASGDATMDKFEEGAAAARALGIKY
jgi:hypothetical protein